MILISYLSLLVWIYLALLHGRRNISKDHFFWSNKIIFEKQQLHQINHDPKICAIIPARNEEKTILKTLNSLKKQNIENLYIIVVDDNSSDKTSSVVNLFKKKFKSTYLLTSKDLPTGWVGKAWALKQGVDFANKKYFDYYTFIDSDIVIKKNLLRKVSSFMSSRKLLMISLMAKLNCKSVWEKILIPPFIFFFQKLYPFNSVINYKSKISAAAGGFIFCQAEIFREINLYNQIKNKVIDDCNIAKLLKKRGKIWLGLTNQVISKRKYHCFREIWNMVTRTAFEQLKYSFILLIISLLGLIVTYLLPYLLIFLSFTNLIRDELSVNLLIPNILSIIMMLVVFYPTVHFYKIKKMYVFILPISAIIYGAMTFASALNYFLFKGNSWKGRVY